MTRPNRRSGWIAALVGSVVLQAAPVVAQAPVQTPAPAPAAPPIARYGYEVVATYPHDPSAFTQGLVIADGVLTESTGRHPSSVRRVRLSDGEVLTRRDLDPALFGEGLTVMGDRAFSLTWTDGKIFVWNAADLTPVGEHPLAGQGWGLTHDGTRLILSDGEPHLRFLDPTTLAETGSVPVTIGGRPLGRLNELEFIDDEVWANVWQTDFIVRINPASPCRARNTVRPAGPRTVWSPWAPASNGSRRRCGASSPRPGWRCSAPTPRPTRNRPAP